MKYKIKLAQLKRWIALLYWRCFNIYPCSVAHDKDGHDEYDIELFKSETPYLEKTIKSIRRAGFSPNIDDMIYGDNEVYFIIKICYFEYHCCFFVDEKKDNSDEYYEHGEYLINKCG